MANKDPRHEPDPARHPDDLESEQGDRGEADVDDAGTPVDETIRVDGEDSTSEVTRQNVESSELTDTTADIFDDDFPEAEGPASSDQSVIASDPHATLIPQVMASEADEGKAEESQSDEGDSAQDPDATVGMQDSTVRFESRERIDEPPQPTPPTVDPEKMTLSDVDQTIAINLPKSAKSAPTVRSGVAADRAQQEDAQDGTTVNVPKGTGSIMTSSEIGQTINPRELSKQDAAAWSSAVGGGSEPSVLPPAIDRTFSDKQFDRLRKCDIAELKSDVTENSDYRLVRKLGEGGMGDVYTARQGSLDRLLALKLIKPMSGKKRAQLIKAGKLETVEQDRRQQFLSEAIVTGDLDHPNIVPIHDVALTSKNELFYSMKRVVGTPWSDVIKEKSRDENIEILLKAADAVGFAHTRGVVHRDIKPENIMLGDFGVVMVMDWGLALPTSDYGKHDSIFTTSGLGGTPAFMAPEMATGPLETIGPAADIYLLGATLYMIITGRAPHQAKNVTECLKAVRSNEIRGVPDEQKGELLDIALKAMATRPEDRFADVASFQHAIREYRSHAESISLASAAAEDLDKGRRDRSYSDFSRAAFRFEEATKSWQGNIRAHEGLAETKLAHATAAYENGDYDLGLSLLDDDDPEHRPLIDKLRHGIRERDSHASRLAIMRKAAAAMLGIIIVGGAVGGGLIYTQRGKALTAAEELAAQAEELAEAEKTKTEKAEQLAAAEKVKTKQAEALAEAEKVKAKQAEALAQSESEKKNAEIEKAQALAEAEKTKTEKAQALAEAEKSKKEELAKINVKLERTVLEKEQARKDAIAEQERAQYEAYVSSIGLAKARLERNEANGARDILRQLQTESPERADSWEWRWLWQQANQFETNKETQGGVLDQALSGDGRQSLIALAGGQVELLALNEEGRLIQQEDLIQLPDPALKATSVAIAPDHASAAIGTQTGDIYLLQLPSKQLRGKPLSGHGDTVTDLQFTADGLLVSASMDKTVRVWNIASEKELTENKACWHISPVIQIAAATSGDLLTVAAATSDDVTGQIAIWKLRRRGNAITVERVGTLTDHRFPVSSVAISARAGLVASGDIAGNLLIWDPDTVGKIDYGGRIKDALAKLNGRPQRTNGSRPEKQGRDVPLVRLVDTETQQRLVSTNPTPDDIPRAHNDVIRSIRFSRDGRSLLTGSEDYTLKLWDVPKRSIRKTLKGHGGWVVGGSFLRGRDAVIVSASNDASVRTWRPADYTSAFVVHQLVDKKGPATPTRKTQAHEEDVWSARFSLQGDKVVTASRDHTARIMAIDRKTLSFQEVARLDDEVLDEGTSFVAMSLQVDRPRQRLYIGSADATIRVWDLKHGTQIDEVTQTGLNTSFAVSSDGQWMLTGSSKLDEKAKWWRLDPSGQTSPRVVHRLKKGHEEAVTAFAISPDSKLLFTGDRGGLGNIWNASTGRRVGEPLELLLGNRINAASFSADGKRLLIGSDDEQLTVIDVASRRLVTRLNHKGYVTQLSICKDERHALTVSELVTDLEFVTTATLWDLHDGQKQVLDRVASPLDPDRGYQRTNPQRITSARFDDAGRVAVVSRAEVGAAPALIRVWKMSDLIADRGLMSPSRRTLTSTDVSSKSLSASRIRQSATNYHLPKKLGTSEAIVPMDERTLLTMNRNGAFQWDLDTEELVKSYRAHAELPAAGFSYDGKYVATGSRAVKIWDATTGEALAKLESTGTIRSLQFAPKSVGPTRYELVIGGDEGIAGLWRWDPAARKITRIEKLDVDQGRKENRRKIRRVRFSPDGDRLFVVGDRGLAQLWDLRPAKLSMSMKLSDRQDLICAAFSKDGQFVAAGGTDEYVTVWKPAEKTFQPILLKGHAGDINDVVFLGTAEKAEANAEANFEANVEANVEPKVEAAAAAEERYRQLRLMTASADRTAKVWDPQIGAKDKEGQHPGGREIITLERHQGSVTSVDATEGGRLFMTAGADGAVILWPADPPPNLFDVFADDKEE